MKDNNEISEDQRNRSIKRSEWIALIFIIFAFILLLRAFYLQTFKYNYFKELAKGQYVKEEDDHYDRGNIFFSNYKEKISTFAGIVAKYKLVIDPSQIEKGEEVYELINSKYKIDKDIFLKNVSYKSFKYREIARNLSEQEKKEILSLKIKGVSLVLQNKRYYPFGEIGAKIIGFVGNNGTQIRGQYGIERSYNDILMREDSVTSVNIFAEIFSDIQKTKVSNLDKKEGDIVLTIDGEAQRFLYKVLVETKKEWESDVIGGIIMDPNTGKIIAMESLPSFSPADFSKEKDVSVFSNQMISGVYEMGSIIKPITMASALDAGVVTEKTVYKDTGFRDLNGYKVRNYDGGARGPGTIMQTILDKSLNVGIVFLVEQLGIEKFQEYFKNFGIGSETGIDLPNEASGLTKNLDSSVFVDSATAGFGQGIAITPIQTIRALSVLGNGGKLIDPYVVDSVLYKDGETKKIIPNEGKQILKVDTSERISRMLVHVVDTALKNGQYKMDHYSIAAKTGTAQMVKPGGGYYDDRYLHSIFAYFPAYEPKYIVFIYHTYPKGAEYASATLTDPLFRTIKFLISYYEVPPDR